ncbi:MAG: hypothetical protein ACK46X_15920 [Candidatus Sericytochromatia bacterium]
MPAFRPDPELLDRALVSLVAWHVLEALALGPASGVPVAAIVIGTGLEVTALRRAIRALALTGMVVRTADGRLALAPKRAEAMRRLVEAAAADRVLHRALIKEAARRELSAGPLWGGVGARRVSARSAPR